MVSEGKNPEGETVAKFYVTWSFKRKSRLFELKLGKPK
jgi:hypothetical protein